MYNFINYNIGQDLTDCGAKLLNGLITGIEIDNFINISEASKIKEAFYNLPLNSLTVVDDGFVSYPLSFAQLTQGLQTNTINPDNFFTFGEEFKNNFLNTFGVDILGRLKLVVKRLFNIENLYVPQPKNGIGSFVPFTFRELKPGNGELKVHCENLFFSEFPYFFSLLDHIVLRKNEFSFFIVISSPEEGGELTLFNANWDKVKERENFTTLKDNEGNLIDILSPNIIKLKLKPKVGSLLIFSGGDIWHRVEVVKGSHSRITIGGFISAGKKSEDLYVWS